MFSCEKRKSFIQLIQTTELNFPSASAIEFYNNKLYVFGDDATYLLVLSKDYRLIDSTNYWGENIQRIPKTLKPDIESSFVNDSNGQFFLTGIGSMSDTNRWKVVSYNLTSGTINTSPSFLSGKQIAGIEQLNIEGSTVVNQTFVLANRANLSNAVNHLVFYNQDKTLTTKKLHLPLNKTIAGISGLFYVKEKDLLLLTASEEETFSTTMDGAIGESYLGGIQNFSGKINDAELKSDFFYRLSDVDKQFTKQKIESVCLEAIENGEMVLHLAADNDNGKSRLFKLRVKL